MKNLILATLLLLSMGGLASNADSLFQRHQISFSVSNGMSHEFLNDPSGKTSTSSILIYTGNPMGSSNYQFLPGYALYFNILYSLGISRFLRIETGIGYLLQGLVIKFRYLEDGFGPNLLYINQQGSETINEYDGSISVPIHMKMRMAVRGGYLTCTIGPNFFIPTNFRQKISNYYINGIPQPDNTLHQKYDMQTIAYNSSVGLDLRVGYEIHLNKKSSLDIGPLINFENLIFIDKNLKNYYTNLQYRPYRYYVGLDVAVNFGLRK